MTEIDVTGINPIDHPVLSTWGWPVVGYLFIGGLVGGLMIVTPFLRRRPGAGWDRAVRAVDLWSLPLLALGLVLLLLDLSYKLHAWRFYAAFEPTSAMWWGAWILLVSAAALAMRAVARLGEVGWFATHAPAPVRRAVARVETLVMARRRVLDGSAILIGAALAFYTGVLLSTIPARPLWDSVLLAPLFLISGIAAAGAFVCLLLSPSAHRRMMPTAMRLCLAELGLIAAFLLTLVLGGPATRAAAGSLFRAPFGAVFWVVVVALGLVTPLVIERRELRRAVSPLLSRLAPVLKLTGSAALRVVVVLAGLQTVA